MNLTAGGSFAAIPPFFLTFPVFAEAARIEFNNFAPSSGICTVSGSACRFICALKLEAPSASGFPFLIIFPPFDEAALLRTRKRLPSRTDISSSAKSASSGRCVLNSTVCPETESERRRAIVFAREGPSSPAVGSSKSSTGASSAMIPATASRRFSPPQSSAVCRSAYSAYGMPASSIERFTSETSAFPRTPRFPGPKATSSAAKRSKRAASLFCLHKAGRESQRISP